MTLQQIGAALGIIIGSSTVLGGAGNYYLENEYVSNDALHEQFLQNDVRSLKREQRKLERLNEDMRTPQQKWELEQLEEDIEELQDEIDQLPG